VYGDLEGSYRHDGVGSEGEAADADVLPTMGPAGSASRSKRAWSRKPWTGGAPEVAGGDQPDASEADLLAEPGEGFGGVLEQHP
jgi:hypothetical protein